MSSDIRKWFMKQHDKGNGTSTKTAASQKSSQNISEKVKEDEGNFQRRKTSKYFTAASDAEKKSMPIVKDELGAEKVSAKRKNQKGDDNIQNEVKPSPAKRFCKDADDDDDFAPSREKKKLIDTKPMQNLKNNATRLMKKSVDDDKSEERDDNDEDVGTPIKGGGRGRGGQGLASAIGGRGGRGG